MPELKELKEVGEAVSELRKTVETFGEESSDFKEKAAKIEKDLDKFEKSSQDALLEAKRAVKEAEEMAERLQVLELEMAKGASNLGLNYKDSEEYKALCRYTQVGDKISDGEYKTLRMDSDVAGGVLTSTEMDNVITKQITEISPVRSIARVRTVGKKTLEMPIRKGIPVATYESETQSGDDSESNYGNEQVTCYRLTTTVPFTMDLLGDSNFDLEAEVSGDVSEAFAFTEGNKFVLGTDSKEPEGFLVNPSIVAGATETASSGAISGDDLILLTGELKVGYNPLFGFNRQTLAKLRTLKGSDGHYLWQMGLAPNAPNTIAGDPYVVLQDMPSIAAGALSVIYGDFARGYVIIDRTGMVMVRDEYSKKRQAIIEMTFHKWNTGKVVLAEAFKALKIKA